MVKSTRIVAVLVLKTVFACDLLEGQQQGTVAERDGVDLLDRGSVSTGPAGRSGRTHTTPMLMTNILSNGGSPGVTMAVPLIGPSFLLPGYFFTAPADFPTSFYPFAVTGAYGYLGGTIGYFGTPMLGVAVAPSAPTPMHLGSFVAALPFTLMGTPGVGMLFSAMFPHSPAIMVPTGSGAFCGAGGLGIGGLGGLTPGTGGGKPLLGLSPTMSSLAPFPAPPATYVVGCFISGATVPVELQAFEVD